MNNPEQAQDSDKEMKEALDHLQQAEKDLEAARAAEEAAENEIHEACEEIEEAEKHRHESHFEITIDRKGYRVEERQLTGIQLWALPTPQIGPERDLFEVIPGGSDLKSEDNDVVHMRNGLRFFTAPAHINPGAPMTRKRL
jgi:hypothetical protein